MVKFTYKRVWLEEENKWRDVTPREQIVLACLVDDAIMALEAAHGIDLEQYKATITYCLEKTPSVLVDFKNLQGNYIHLTMNVHNVYYESKPPKMSKPCWTIKL